MRLSNSSNWIKTIAKQIVKAINKTTNDYDAAEAASKVLKKYFNLKEKQHNTNGKSNNWKRVRYPS